jgi:DNA polymerase-3 subunit delta
MHANEVSLFSSSRMILVENSYIFTGTTNKKLPEQNLLVLEEYLKNPNENTILIFSIYKDKLDERKKIVKICKEKGYLKEFNQNGNTDKILLDLFKPYTISKEDLSFFINRVGENLSILEQEVNKMKIYKDQDMTITKEDILLLTSKNIDVDIFNLIDNIITSNKEKAIESYHEMLKLGEEPIMIVIMLANQFRMIYQVKKLYQKGYSEKDISSILKVHWYPVRKTLGKMQNYQEDKLLHYLKELANLDIQIKTGKIDKEIGLELFILNI